MGDFQAHDLLTLWSKAIIVPGRDGCIIGGGLFAS